MVKKHIKITIIVVLSLMIAFEIGYIVKINILNDKSNDKTTAVTPTPSALPVVGMTEQPSSTEQAPKNTKPIIVIDPGHGKPSSLMTEEEKRKSGWVQNKSGEWGEWRHYKIGSSTADCEGTGCNGRVTPNGACWYPIGNSDRNTEPDINLNNALAAKKELEKMGYEVRITRTTNDENPSITRRLSYCYPDNDTSKAPDAKVCVVLHSNAAGSTARGTAYVEAQGPYDQAWITPDYEEYSNELGRLCNDYIAQLSSLEICGNGVIAWEPELIAFCKSPVPCAYLEIGFFDNDSDLAILNSESENIGAAIARGVDDFCKTH